MATQAEIQANIDLIVTNGNYTANEMRALLTSMLDFSTSGSFASVFSSPVGAVTATSGPDGVFSQVGDVVTYTFSVNLDLDFTIALNGTVYFTLPIPRGSGVGYGTVSFNTAENVTGIISNNTLTVNSLNAALVLSTLQAICSVQYIVI